MRCSLPDATLTARRARPPTFVPSGAAGWLHCLATCWPPTWEARGRRLSIRSPTWRSAWWDLLGEQAASERDAAAAERVMRTNYVGPALLLGALAERFAARGSGILVGVSSVAGERGRAANYVYGSAKAGLTALLSGLRNRLAHSGVQVLTVKPGYVRTRMTAGMRLPAALTATPDAVAVAVVAALQARRDVVYVPRIWRLIMLLVRALPERMFKRMKL